MTTACLKDPMVITSHFRPSLSRRTNACAETLPLSRLLHNSALAKRESERARTLAVKAFLLSWLTSAQHAYWSSHFMLSKKMKKFESSTLAHLKGKKYKAHLDFKLSSLSSCLTLATCALKHAPFLDRVPGVDCQNSNHDTRKVTRYADAQWKQTCSPGLTSSYSFCATFSPSPSASQ